MDPDIINKILPILNAAGIPLLGIGFILLILSYRKSVEAYKDTTSYLLEENKRLREQVREVDSDYFDKIGKVRETITKSMDAIAELQARKVELLAKPEKSKDSVFSDIERINEVISLLHSLSRDSKRVKMENLHTIEEMEEMIRRKEFEIGELTDQIGDTKSRVIVVSVLTTEEVFQKLKSKELEDSQSLKTRLKEIKDSSKTLELTSSNKFKDDIDKTYP